ncbi:DEAD/DEAH box helicase family protein [Prevotella jejuni]|uniref:type I restriction endonuclease subunit R n=1 Tax=Prevotella jejuni TaxID=1177574 RepID=UPI0028E65F2E|nr:DEAD/DEAH box helicase family protein [Prevotella jejuni]
MAKNFDYILLLADKIPTFKHLHNYCRLAEEQQPIYPDASANNARKALEWLMKNMLKMAGVTVDARATLNDMLRLPATDAFVNRDYKFREDIYLVKKIGNAASHDGAELVNRVKAFRCLRALYNVVAGFMGRWDAVKDIPPFDATLISSPSAPVALVKSPEPKVEMEVVNSVRKESLDDPQPVVLPRESLASEAVTRRYLIDYMLMEAGWEILEEKGKVLGGKACIEVEVDGMPTASGKGYADYVLFSRGGKPLAVIEAKATSHAVTEGRHQATLYADCLEKRYGVRPVIYYTNGFTTKVIDGMGYPDRDVISFHAMDDLERLIQKRGRAEIKDVTIKEEITDRPYQQTAIKRIVEWFNAKHRRGLLVLATGTGKTRVSISLCDILMRNDWVKTVLFLADRTALVSQAHKNYEALLPSVSMSVLSEEKAPDMQARILFSTYQTMINYLDREDKAFSVGRFDLIIIDEAHRSVFGRYGAIFSYFDSLLIGLTATPRDEIDRNTYDLLQLDNGMPNYSYDIDEAVKDGYLCPYKTLQYHSKIMERGAKWDEMSKEDREEAERLMDYEKSLAGLGPDDEYHRDILPQEIFKYLFNIDTVDKVLMELMEKGLKVKSGEEIGKTIIFAMNHHHAELIVERFRTLYPEKEPDYCQLIDNYVNKAHSLILDFEQMDKYPQIAVSVDMLDTGVDVPSVLNLVFFKCVRSKIKFMQMIGRGTRLCPKVFGDADKKEFYIFDWCGNFEYFSVNSDGANPVAVKSLTERLYALRLDIAAALQSAEHQEKEDDRRLHDELKEILHAQVSQLSRARIDVRAHLQTIEPYREREAWVCLSDLDVAELKGIAHLLPRPKENEAAKKFDVLMLYLQLELVDSTVKADNSRASVIKIAQLLEKKATIPAVRERMETIKEVQTAVFWEHSTLNSLERVRKELRELVHVLAESRDERRFVINIEDAVSSDAVAAPVTLKATYHDRVIDYLAKHTDNEVLRKIQNFEQLTTDDVNELQRIFWEELGTRTEFDEATNGKKYNHNVAAFIRVIQGVDRQKALALYTRFIKDGNLTGEQEQYLKEILNYLSENGDLQMSDFMEYPLNRNRWRDVFGEYFVGLKDFVNELHNVIS